MKIDQALLIILAILLLPIASANAQDLSIQQRILMPGPLISDHAEYENNCENCHSPFERAQITDRCLECHEDIASDRASASGFHGQSPLAGVNNCETCHTDHEGRDADVLGLVPENFNHFETRFELDGAHQSVSCESCHQEDQHFRDAVSSCVGCHEEQDIHTGALGEQCEDCHLTQSWQQQTEFDHSSTDFALDGSHENVSCSSCHIGQQYEFTDTTCVTCHRATDVHGGGYGDECSTCHDAESWDTVVFNHDDTSFPLEGAHADTACRACHEDGSLNLTEQFSQATQSDLFSQLRQTNGEATRSCVDCHEEEDIHLGRNGQECESCHAAIAWPEFTFDHNADTAYSLTGAHEELACTQCHTGSLTDTLATDCVSCHLADDVHLDADMTLCRSCHVTQEWTLVSQFDHDFSLFPLLGMHRIAPCQSCHLDEQFGSTASECADCHQLEDVHESSLGTSCSQCHTPNAWNIWQFDHGAQTDFQLQGQHQDLSCAACHLPDTEAENTASDCASCHSGQDIHRGDFGTSCEQCHNSSSFAEILSAGGRL